METVPARLADLPSYIIYILFNPALNPKAALIIYAATGVLLLIVLAIGVALITRLPKDQRAALEDSHADSAEPGEPDVGEVAEQHPEEAAPVTPPPTRRPKTPAPPLSKRARIIVGVVVVVALVAIWGIAGYTTSDSDVCKGCHWPAAQHAQAVEGGDPHVSVACVSCHESGGVVGRYFTAVPARVLHFAMSQSAEAQPREYGRVSVSACSSCHEPALTGVVANEERGLRVSHSEPLAASAVCLDCHTLSAGVVGTHNAGMGPCLRCHDSKQASATCETCHDEKAASAARARTASFSNAQIKDVSCGGCHNEKKECDGGHGLRMPHTTEFKMYAHARAGAVDFWYNGGKTCARCHTATRRPCQKCHGAVMGRAHGTNAWLGATHQSAKESSCDGCHGLYAYSATRDFCADICHTPAAIEASPR